MGSGLSFSYQEPENTEDLDELLALLDKDNLFWLGKIIIIIKALHVSRKLNENKKYIKFKELLFRDIPEDIVSEETIEESIMIGEPLFLNELIMSMFHKQ